jgi:hypothetical protein
MYPFRPEFTSEEDQRTFHEIPTKYSEHDFTVIFFTGMNHEGLMQMIETFIEALNIGSSSFNVIAEVKRQNEMYEVPPAFKRSIYHFYHGPLPEAPVLNVLKNKMSLLMTVGPFSIYV